MTPDVSFVSVLKLTRPDGSAYEPPEMRTYRRSRPVRIASTAANGPLAGCQNYLE